MQSRRVAMITRASSIALRSPTLVSAACWSPKLNVVSSDRCFDHRRHTPGSRLE